MTLRCLAVLFFALGVSPLLRAGDYAAEPQDVTLEQVVHHWADHLGKRLVWEAPAITIGSPTAFNAHLSLAAAPDLPVAWERLNYGLTHPRFSFRQDGADVGPQDALRVCLFTDVMLVRPVAKGCGPRQAPSV